MIISTVDKIKETLPSCRKPLRNHGIMYLKMVVEDVSHQTARDEHSPTSWMTHGSHFTKSTV